MAKKKIAKKKKTFRIRYLHGGARRGAGRRTDPMTKHKVQLSCFLRRETIEALREAAGSKFVGEFLQWHLDHHGIPTRSSYLYSLREDEESRKRQVAYELAKKKAPPLTRKEREFQKAVRKAARAAFDEEPPNGRDQPRKNIPRKPVANKNRRAKIK